MQSLKMFQLHQGKRKENENDIFSPVDKFILSDAIIKSYFTAKNNLQGEGYNL